MDAYSSKITSILYNGFPEQERFAGNQIDILLIIYPSGRFRFKVTKYSPNREFNEILIRYLEELQNIGFDRHTNLKPYRFKAAKDTVIKLVKQLKGYYISVIFFSGIPFIRIPFSNCTD
jgi:hypothetical protein